METFCLADSLLLFSLAVQERDYCLGRVKSVSSMRIICPLGTELQLILFGFFFFILTLQLVLAGTMGSILFLHFALFLFNIFLCCLSPSMLFYNPLSAIVNLGHFCVILKAMWSQTYAAITDWASLNEHGGKHLHCIYVMVSSIGQFSLEILKLSVLNTSLL